MRMLPEIATTRFVQARRVLFVGSCLAAIGCSQGASLETTEENKQAVIDGQPSPAADDSVFVIIDPMGTWCSAVAVAPNLALTARRCVASGENIPRLKCDSETGLGFPIQQVADPSTYATLFGNQVPLSNGPVPKRFFAGPTLDLCLNDVVLVEFEAPLPVGPMRLRLDGPATYDEQGTLIGWGYDVNDAEGSPLPPQRRKVSLTVLKMGPNDYAYDGGGVFSIPANAFLTGQGACNGDYGGPFVSADTGAVVGLVSDVEPFDLGVGANASATSADTRADCVAAHTVFADLVSQQDWIRAAFVEVGQAPWLEGYQAPAEVGQSCHNDAECISGTCSLTDQGGFCTARCDAQTCPAEMQCVPVNGASWCVPSVAGGSATSSGCSIGLRTRQLTLWTFIGYCAPALLFIRRSRSRPNRCSPPII